MIQKLTPEQADNIIRASWPAHNDIDYSVHTGECSQDCEDNDHALPGAPIALLLLLLAACVVAGAVWLTAIVAGLLP